MTTTKRTYAQYEAAVAALGSPRRGAEGRGMMKTEFVVLSRYQGMGQSTWEVLKVRGKREWSVCVCRSRYAATHIAKLLRAEAAR